jgi:hypothetical protein
MLDNQTTTEPDDTMPPSPEPAAPIDYWAASPIEEIAQEIESKFDNYRQWLQTSGYANRIRSTYNTFYGFNDDGTIQVTRDRDNLAHINVNHYKSLMSRLHIMITESKLDFQPRAINSDPKSDIEANLAKGICEYYNSEKDMNSTTSMAVLSALIMLETYVHAPWDLSEGYELTADEQGVIKTGDQMFENFNPFEVAKNTSITESNWFIIRKKVNKYDLAALFPLFASEILAETLATDVDGLRQALGTRNLSGGGDTTEDDEDYVWKFILYHARTPSMPQGRHVEIAAGQVLADGKLKYDKIPLFRLTAGNILSTCYGDSPAIELLPLQHALNALYSATTTNNLNNSVQLIYSADPNLTTRKLEDGQTLVSSASPPSALNLTGSSAENFKMLDRLQSDQQLLSGVNDVVRGNPSQSVKTSGGQALMIAQAQQYVSDLAKGYADLASDLATCLISNIQKFASEQMTAYIVGSSKKGQIKQFQAKDIMHVQRVTVDLGNPLTSSLAGRSELLSQWMQYGVITKPEQTIEFLTTGNLEQDLDDEFNQQTVIAEQMELLKSGKMPIILSTDNHTRAILQANKILAQNDVRMDANLVNLVNAYMQQHIQLMRTLNPDLAAVLSGQPLPPQQPPAPPPGQGAPGQPPQPSVQGVNLPHIPDGAPPQTQQSYQQATQATPPDPTKG